MLGTGLMAEKPEIIDETSANLIEAIKAKMVMIEQFN